MASSVILSANPLREIRDGEFLMFKHPGGLDSAKNHPPRSFGSAESYARRLVQVAALSCLAATAFVTGCGPKSDRLALDGTVTLDGKALDDGSIRFSSAAGPD